MNFTVIYVYKPLKVLRQTEVRNAPSGLNESELYDHLLEEVANQEQCLTSHIRIERWH